MQTGPAQSFAPFLPFQQYDASLVPTIEMHESSLEEGTMEAQNSQFIDTMKGARTQRKTNQANYIKNRSEDF